MKLKKSLLIVPAMATLLLAAAGSVGGTVAWFSATTTFQTNVSTFKVVRLDGNLSCQMLAGVGTKQNGENGIAVGSTTANTEVELTHASFNHNDGTVYVQTATNTYAAKSTIAANNGTASDGIQAGTYTDVVESTTINHIVYYAVTWQMNFTYTLPSSTATSGTATNLYFDLATSVMTATQGTGEQSKHTNKGFRIAFYPNTNTSITTNGNKTNKRVWADLQEKANCSYVSGTSTTANYSGEGDVTLLDSANTHTIPVGTAAAVTEDICLGGFRSFTAGASKIGFTCVAWFEGTDENVIDESTLDTVATTLAFYTRTSTADA